MAVLGPTYYYIDPAKTASQAIQTVLLKHYNGWHKAQPVRGFTPPNWHYVFASVRNPYERVVSLWWSTCRTNGDYYGWRQHCPDPVTMIGWIMSKEWQKIEDKQFAERTPPWSNLLHTMHEWTVGLKLDGLLRFETLDEDFKKLPFYKGVPAQLPVVNRKANVSQRPAMESFMTPEFVEAVNVWCEKDFDVFGYKMRKP